MKQRKYSISFEADVAFSGDGVPNAIAVAGAIKQAVSLDHRPAPQFGIDQITVGPVYAMIEVKRRSREPEHPLSAGRIIDARRARGDKLDWQPSEEDPSFPAWVMDEMKRAHDGRYYPHAPYTDLGIEILESIGMWPWRKEET